MTDLAALEALIEAGDADAARALDAALTKHHGTRQPKTMHALHLLAARFWKADPAQVGFHLTHAYVYALEAGMWAQADALYLELSKNGRI